MKEFETQCPVCGAEVHPNSRGCKSCGARRDAGEWNRPEAYDGLDLPGEDEDDFDYDDFIAREFGEKPANRWREIPPKRIFWWVVAVVTLVAFFFAFVL